MNEYKLLGKSKDINGLEHRKNFRVLKSMSGILHSLWNNPSQSLATVGTLQMLRKSTPESFKVNEKVTFQMSRSHQKKKISKLFYIFVSWFNGGGNGYPLQYSRLENPHGQRSLGGYCLWGCRVGHDWSDLAHHDLKHLLRIMVYIYHLNCLLPCSNHQTI